MLLMKPKAFLTKIAPMHSHGKMSNLTVFGRYYSSTLWKEQLKHNPKLYKFVEETVEKCKPKDVHVCDGSDAELQKLIALQVEDGLLTPLSKRKNSYVARSDPGDVARLESATFICSEKESDAPKGVWKDPKDMKALLGKLFDGTMRGRTLYVVPFSMGPVGSDLAKIGVQLTDSPYVTCALKVMSRMGEKALKTLGDSSDFVPCLHSVGKPLKEGERDNGVWPSSVTKYICHFPDEYKIISYGSGYGGNSILSKKCFALRIASKMGKDQGWLAEHMLVLGITNPEGKKKYICGAFPSACGKTNLAMVLPTIPGWKVEVVGDDIAWLKKGKDGRLHAINAEKGMFGVAPGSNDKSNPNIMKALNENVIYTNVAVTEDGDVWWEGLTKEVPENMINWLGEKHDPSSGQPAAHPNSRFTVPMDQCPVTDPAYEDPEGVPISAIIFGGRRSTKIPLVYESFDWNHGTMLGASMRSEVTAAALDVKEAIRADPFAMKPFFGYHVGDYFQHWIDVGADISEEKRPKIFHVNWFRKDSEGRFIWPGFGENSRVLKWIFERFDNPDKNAKMTPIGVIPEELDTNGLDVSAEDMEALFRLEKDEWVEELHDIREAIDYYSDDKPCKALNEQVNKIEKKVQEWDLL